MQTVGIIKEFFIGKNGLVFLHIEGWWENETQESNAKEEKNWDEATNQGQQQEQKGGNVFESFVVSLA